MMTIQQQAYELIDELPDDSVKVMIELMSRMPKATKISIVSNPLKDETSKERKRAAFERMKKLRKSAAEHKIEDVETARYDAVKEKYGAFM